MSEAPNSYVMKILNLLDHIHNLAKELDEDADKVERVKMLELLTEFIIGIIREDTIKKSIIKELSQVVEAVDMKSVKNRAEKIIDYIKQGDEKSAKKYIEQYIDNL